MIRVKKVLKTLGLLFSIMVFIASCASKPAPPPPEPTPPPVVVTPVEPVPEPPKAPVISQDELDQLLAQVQELKKKAFDLKLFEVLSDDYKAANALYSKGFAAYNDQDAIAAKEGLGVAISAYGDLIARGVVLVAADRRKDAEDMKSTATKAGADSTQVERFGAGDECFKGAAALVDDSKSEEAIPVFITARLYYELAWKRAIASEVLANIEDRDFAKWDSGNFQLADNKYQAEDGFWASENETTRAGGVDALDEAILRFNLVVQKGREMTASTVKSAADEARQRSQDIRANVAVKDMFDAAQELYAEGSSELAAKNYEAAAYSFDRAGTGFNEAYEVAADKRAKAQEAMKAADEATSESQRKAEDADPLLQSDSP